jgi:hypothetical protein
MQAVGRPGEEEGGKDHEIEGGDARDETDGGKGEADQA